MKNKFHRYFEFKDDKSSKFWSIDLNGTLLTVNFGRIGTEGQIKEKEFSDAAQAMKEAEKLIKEKLGKGYIEIVKKSAQKKADVPINTEKKVNATVNGTMTKTTFEKEFGKIAIQKDPQKYLIEGCKVAVNDFDEEHDFDQPKNPPKLINGTLYNIGFLKEGTTPDKMNFEWDILAKDMRFLNELVQLLKEAKVYHGYNDLLDSKYFPIIFHDKITDTIFKKDFLKALNIPFGQIKGKMFPRIIPQLIFATDRYKKEERIKNDKDLEGEFSKKQIEACKEVNLMYKKYFTKVEEIYLLSGYDKFPAFKIGKTKEGRWLGLMALVSDKVIVSDQFI